MGRPPRPDVRSILKLHHAPTLAPRVADVLLVDDFEIYIQAGQESQWVKVDYFDYPYDENDNGLVKVLRALEQRLGQA